MDYQWQHIYKIGVITRPPQKLVTPGLRVLRDNHLFCLQLDCVREDFGTVTDDYWTSP